MCGILCILGLAAESEQAARNLATSLTRRLRHRGPDWSGMAIYQDSQGKYAMMCHERLAIVDPASGEQPLYGCENNVCVCANGEIFNHQILKEQIQDHELHTGSDCEVIAHLYEKHGADFVSMLNGQFACVIYDVVKQKLIAFRDHVGICPLYIGWGTRGEIWISSELKAIHDQCPRFQSITPGTIFDSETGEFTRWYNPIWWDEDRIPTTQVNLSILRQKVEQAVVKEMMSDVPFGVLISGGLDSSIISAIVVKHSNERFDAHESRPAWFPKIHSFAVGLKESPDLRYAKEVASYIGTVHHEFNFTVQQGIDALKEVIYFLETYNPTTIRASTPMYFMARKIKAMGFKMVLSGEGADEVYGGYLYFHKAPNKEELHKECVQKVKDLHLYDLLRGNKAMMAHGVELRVPFLDRTLLEYALDIDPQCKMPRENERSIEKYILRKAFEDYLPGSVLWRQKEQFSDGVGYSWIDTLKSYSEKTISDDMFKNAHIRFPINTPRTKEAYLYRQMFEEHFPERSAIESVPGTPSVACSTARALEWDESFKKNTDESGRSVLGVHSSAKQFEDAGPRKKVKLNEDA
jgi:asparagine synthase (glutamine-hydrolysing)